MTAMTRLKTPPVSAYAPGSASTHISEVTVAAVDKIGSDTSDRMRHTAETIEADAKRVADKLRELADAFDEQTRIASEKISGFCLKMASARSVITSLETEIKGQPEMPAIDDGAPSPEFLHNTDAAGRPNGRG